jgi:hypothetical protein
MEATLAAKRTLFEAAVGDSDDDTVTRGSLASRIATVMGEGFAAATAPAAGPHGGGSGDPVARAARQPAGCSTARCDWSTANCSPS